MSSIDTMSSMSSTLPGPAADLVKRCTTVGDATQRALGAVTHGQWPSQRENWT